MVVRRPPSWILKIRNFNGRRGSRRVSVANFVTIGKIVAETCDFPVFKTVAVFHLGFLKIRNFYGDEVDSVILS